MRGLGSQIKVPCAEGERAASTSWEGIHVPKATYLTSLRMCGPSRGCHNGDPFKVSRPYRLVRKRLGFSRKSGSGVIAGACRNLLNDRLELTGMSWTIQGAESMMRLRAVPINKDWAPFWKHRRQSERRRLYGIDDTSSVEIRDQELQRAA